MHPAHKELLNLFSDLLDIILTDQTLESESQEDENEKVESRKEENEYENENEDKYENADDDEYKYENEDDDEAMDQKKKSEIIKGLNDNLDEIIDKSKSFEEQIELLKKLENLKEYLPYKNYDDKELKSKYFKIELADMSNEIDKKLFEQIFGHTLIKLADKLINTTNKEENQIIVKNIEKNKDKLFKMDKFNDWVIQPSHRCINLKDAIDLILDFNKELN